MRLFALVFLCLLSAAFCSASLSAQGKAKTVEIKKGEAFDIIFLNNTPGSEALAKAYFDEIFPPAQAGGYQPLPGFGVAEAPTQGNYHPEVMVFGSWPSVAQRTETMEKVVQQFPDFHERRRKIWTTFNMTYYSMAEDVSFTTDPGRFYVATMFWSDGSAAYDQFLASWKKHLAKKGGENLLELTNGISPYGYNYNPGYFVLTEWSSKAAFEAFNRQDQALDHTGVRHVNQIVVR